MLTTEIDFANYRHKLMMRRKDRIRRDRFRARRTTATLVSPITGALAPVALHISPSGIVAYRVRRQDAEVTLPWVSILGAG